MDFIHLTGSETVERAGLEMRRAAEAMGSAANTTSEAADTITRAAHLFQEIAEKLARDIGETPEWVKDIMAPKLIAKIPPETAERFRALWLAGNAEVPRDTKVWEPWDGQTTLPFTCMDCGKPVDVVQARCGECVAKKDPGTWPLEEGMISLTRREMADLEANKKEVELLRGEKEGMEEKWRYYLKVADEANATVERLQVDLKRTERNLEAKRQTMHRVKEALGIGGGGTALKAVRSLLKSAGLKIAIIEDQARMIAKFQEQEEIDRAWEVKIRNILGIPDKSVSILQAVTKLVP